MIKKLVLTISLATACLMAWSQGGGFKYDFGEKEASFSPNPGTSSASFLPRLANHSNKGLRTRVRTGSDGSGAFKLTKTGASFISGAGLEIVSGTSTSKLSFYNTGGAPVTKTSFNIKFDDSQAGQWVFANGISEDKQDLFQGNSSIKEISNEIFAAIRWVLGAENEMKFYYRNGGKWSTVRGVSFLKGDEYLIEVYSNNSSEEKTYQRDGEHKVDAGTYHVWANGKRVGESFGTAGVGQGKSLSAMTIYGTTPRTSDTMAKAWIDNLEVSDNW